MNFSGFTRSLQQKKKNIFINYRVHDTAGETGRLVDKLKQNFASDQIFIDIDKIEPGVDFTKAISKSLESCDVMLAIIGPHWLGKTGDENASRIKNPNDWVKLEISSALQRDIRVVPVLVDGAELPEENELPVDLQPLLLRQSYEISNKRWDYDTSQLVDFLIKLGVAPKDKEKINGHDTKNGWWKKNSWWVFVLIGMLITVGVLMDKADQPQENNFQPTYPVENSAPGNTPGQNNAGQNFVDEEPATNAIANVAGTWIENDEGVIYTYNISQNQNELRIDIYLAGQYISSGTGNIQGNSVEIYLNLNGINTSGKGMVSQSGTLISGTYTI
ncbi:MAG: toll/interleukin-1 receptor domain-containing protein [Ginsengibacter sp.]